MGCNLIDIKCIFMNELIGDPMLTVVFAVLLYFILASKLRFGFDTTIAFLIPLLLLTGLLFTGFSAIYAFLTVLIGLGIGWVFQKVIKN